MWLMTKRGFFSIIEKRPGEFHIRSRKRRDIENLVARVPLAAARIFDTPDQRHRPYHEVWQVLADALGAHGRRPATSGSAVVKGKR
jgi:hypothetical protein